MPKRGCSLTAGRLDALPYFVAVCGALAGIALGWPLNRMLAWVFALFNHAFDALGSIYTWIVGKLLTLSVVVLVVYGGLLAAHLPASWNKRPRALFPARTWATCSHVQLPDSASLERTEAVMAQVDQIARSDPGVDHMLRNLRQSFVLNRSGSNFGSMFIRLKDYSERRDPNLASDKILARLTQQFDAKIVDAQRNGSSAAAGARRGPGRRLHADGRRPRRRGAR